MTGTPYMRVFTHIPYSHSVAAMQVSTKPRKLPQQARARATRAAVLEAAAQVLEARGPSGFTTNHVAARAGVSIGSLYQYFPNKLALLRALQEAEQADTLARIASALAGRQRTARARLAAAIAIFFETEAREAPLRSALHQANVYFDNPEIAGAAGARAVAVIDHFLRQEGLAVQRCGVQASAFAVSAVKGLADALPADASRRERRSWARATADMLWRFLEEPETGVCQP